MKRLITILCSICLCLMANAQIQTKFWGLELSENYSSMQIVKEIISMKYNCQVIDKEVHVRSCDFGGRSWDGAVFSFHHEANGYILYNVFFMSIHSTRELAESKQNSLLNSLINKYGDPIYINEMNTWKDSQSRFICSLGCKRDEDGWYVFLAYNDMQTFNLKQQQNDDEL